MKKMFYNGDIITMENTKPEAVLINDGIIEKIGRIKDIGSYNIEKIDLHGKVLMPSFIDSHSHITAVAQSLGIVNLSNCTSFSEIREKLNEYAKNVKSEEWVIGFGYDNNFLKEKNHPNKFDLNMDNPVLITHASGHIGVMNQKGLEILGINNATKNPEGGKFGRIGNSNEPSGYMEENAFINSTSNILKWDLAKYEKLMEKAQNLYIKNGITTVQEGLIKKDNWNILNNMAINNKLKIDVIGYVNIEESEILSENVEYENQNIISKNCYLKNKNYTNRLKIGGYKMFLDGSPQAKTAWLTENYEGEDNYKGYPIHTNEQVDKYVNKSVNDKMQLITHCNGDCAGDQLINALEKYENIKELRPVMIHAQILRKDQIKKMKKIGIIPSYFIAHVYYWGDIHLKNLGKKRAENISPAKTTLQENMIFTFHQDSPVIEPNMLETIGIACERKTKSGILLGEKQKIDVYNALKAVTINASYQYFEEDRKGSIKEGKLADLIVLDKNPLKVRIDEIKNIRILEVYKEGIKIF